MGSATFWAASTCHRALAQLYLRLVELGRVPPLEEPWDPETHMQVWATCRMGWAAAWAGLAVWCGGSARVGAGAAAGRAA